MGATHSDLCSFHHSPTKPSQSVKQPASPPVHSMPSIPSLTSKEHHKHSYSPASNNFHSQIDPPSLSLSSSTMASLQINIEDPVIQHDYRQQWLNSTPTAAQSSSFPHSCSVCYRYFSTIYTTSCCTQNICLDCTERYISSKLPAYLPLSFIPTIELPLSCPHCGQNAGVAFRFGGTKKRHYVPSPSSRSQQRQQQEDSKIKQIELDLLTHKRTSSMSTFDIPENAIMHQTTIKVVA